jgi:hypothetical protein
MVGLGEVSLSRRNKHRAADYPWRRSSPKPVGPGAIVRTALPDDGVFMHLIQFETDNRARAVGIVSGDEIKELNVFLTTRELALEAIRKGKKIAELVSELGTGKTHSYQVLLDEGRVLPPLDHPDPAH